MSNVIYLARSAAHPAETASLMWEKPGRLVSSTRNCAVRAAGEFAKTLGVPAESWQELDDACFGAYYDLPLPGHPACGPAQPGNRYGFAFPQGECVQAFLDRSERVREACMALPEKAVLVVAHFGIIASWCAKFLELSPNDRRLFQPAGHALTAFQKRKSGSGWEMAYFNNTP